MAYEARKYDGLSILVLTEEEAQCLYALTLRGVDWYRSGAMGDAIQRVNDKLDEAGVAWSGGWKIDRTVSTYPYPVWSRERR